MKPSLERAPSTYYVADSAHGGADSNLGTIESPWSLSKGLDSIASGDTLLLQCANTFEGEFTLRATGLGTNDRITIATYGSGAKPIIKASPVQHPFVNSQGFAVVALKLPALNSYITIRDIEFQNALYGIFWQNDIHGSTNYDLMIVGCDFSYMNYFQTSPLYFGIGIHLAGTGNYQGLTVDYCIFGKESDPSSGCFNGLEVETAPDAENQGYTARIFNVSTTGCYSNYAGSGGVSLTRVVGGNIASWFITSSGKLVDGHIGASGVFIQQCDDVTIDNCWIGSTKHYGGSDGSGISIETGNAAGGSSICRNTTIKNSHIYDNEGPAVTWLGDYASYNTIIRDCRIWNNSTLVNSWEFLFSGWGVPATFYRATFVNFHIADNGATGSFITNTFSDLDGNPRPNPNGEYGSPLSYYTDKYHGFVWDDSHFVIVS